MSINDNAPVTNIAGLVPNFSFNVRIIDKDGVHEVKL